MILFGKKFFPLRAARLRNCGGRGGRGRGGGGRGRGGGGRGRGRGGGGRGRGGGDYYT